MEWLAVNNSLTTSSQRALHPREATSGDLSVWQIEHNISAYIRNMSWVFNVTIDKRLLNEFARNRVVDEPAFSTLIFLYSVLIIVGAAGNSLVVCAVARKPAMRTARNMFIVNLAISDLLLCLITMPLTLMEILTKYWPLGRCPFVCKTLGTLQATSIFVSTISITAIALDRYQVIVYPTRKSLQKVGTVIILSCNWVAAIILASPMFIWRTLKHHDINLPSLGIDYIAYCLEEWPIEHGRAYYSLFSLVVQYVLPIITVSVAYSRICHKLKYRYVNSSAVGSSSKNKGCTVSTNRRKPKNEKRMKRTSSLLVSISLIFCISWLPLNIFNLVVDYWNPFGRDRQTMMICYAVCHMMGMSSACSNPLLYGWLNDNFRKEFKEILASMCPCVPVEAIRERVESLRSRVSKRRKNLIVTGISVHAASVGNCSRSRNVREFLQRGECLNIREQEKIVVDAGAVRNYRRGPETMTTENGLQGGTEMTVLTRP
jgi:neuropeptide Y receptor